MSHLTSAHDIGAHGHCKACFTVPIQKVAGAGPHSPSISFAIDRSHKRRFICVYALLTHSRILSEPQWPPANRFCKHRSQNTTTPEHCCTRLLMPTLEMTTTSENSAARPQQLHTFAIALCLPVPFIEQLEKGAENRDRCRITLAVGTRIVTMLADVHGRSSGLIWSSCRVCATPMHVSPNDPLKMTKKRLHAPLEQSPRSVFLFRGFRENVRRDVQLLQLVPHAV